MVGKASTVTATITQPQQPATWPVATKFSDLPESLQNEPLSSDSDDDDVSLSPPSLVFIDYLFRYLGILHYGKF